jgi:hypothetical protein
MLRHLKVYVRLLTVMMTAMTMALALSLSLTVTVLMVRMALLGSNSYMPSRRH